MTSRLFVAVWPARSVLDALEALERPALEDGRWTTRDQWHVTLRFLGSCDEEAAIGALGRLVATTTTATLGPRAVALGRHHLVLPVAGLDRLAGAVALAFDGIGSHREDRPFHGHLTLARCRSPVARWPGSLALGMSWRVRSVAVVASTLQAEGSRYLILGEVALWSPIPSDG